MIKSSTWRLRVAYLVSIAAVLLAWELATQKASRLLVAPPSEVAQRLYEGFTAGNLGGAFAGALLHMVTGLVIALVVALPLGFWIGRSRAASDFFQPVMNAVYAIPPVALLPLLMVWFGLFFEAKVALVALMCVFEMTYSFAAGVRNIPAAYIDVGRMFGASRATIVTRIMFPAVLPFVFTGVRLGLVRAIHGMIIAELFFAAASLGQIMKLGAQRFDSAGVLAVIVLLAVFGLVVQELAKFVEQRFFSMRSRA